MVAELPEIEGKEPELNLVRLQGKSSPVFSLPVVIDEDGEINGKLLCRTASGATRTARGCYVEAVRNDCILGRFLVLETATSCHVTAARIGALPTMADVIRIVASIEGPNL